MAKSKNSRKKPYKRIALIIGSAFAGVFLMMEIAGYGIEMMGRRRPSRFADPGIASEKKTERDNRSLERRFESRIAAFKPRGEYIAIDTAENKLSIRMGDRIILEAVVSCGSGEILQDFGGARRWVFDTPRGVYEVQSKLVNPTWIKPDWAFIEEGEKPPSNFKERVDNDSLGSYALGFGDGYFIHGTLYTRLLGRNVTHGCVRVGDKDLKAVFDRARIGTKVYIF